MPGTHTRVSEEVHEKMKQIAKIEGNNITQQYEIALKSYIKNFEQKKQIQDSRLEIYMNERITKTENHLSSMMARTGIDTSMTLMGLITLLSKLLNVDEKDIMYDLRNEGVKYFTTAIKQDKGKKV